MIYQIAALRIFKNMSKCQKCNKDSNNIKYVGKGIFHGIFCSKCKKILYEKICFYCEFYNYDNSNCTRKGNKITHPHSLCRFWE